MFQKLKDYVKCSVRNRFVLGGYLGAGLTFFSNETIDSDILDLILLPSSAFVLLMTGFGAETYRAYKKMKKHLERYKHIDTRFKNKFSLDYCTQTGVKLAMKEKGLGSLI